MIRASWILYALAVLLIIPAAAASQIEETVQFFIGDKPVEMANSTPAVLSKDVCIPVRQFAEELGAKVNWDGSTGTLTVSDDSGTGVMRVGSRTATIKGIKVKFPYAPYIFGGQAYAPILFFNEMFDQAWVFDPMTRQFTWIPIFPRYRGGYSPPRIIYGPGRRTPSPSTTTPAVTLKIIVSEVASVLLSRTNPKITIRTDVKTITYSVARDAVILRGLVGGQSVEVPFGDIRPGDRVRLQFNEAGIVTSIKAQYNVITGKVWSVGKDTIVLKSGKTLVTAPQVEVILPGSVMGGIQDIQVGDSIAASTSPVSDRVYVVRVLPVTSGRQPDRDDQLTINATGPLGVGDVLVIRFKAEADGNAVFTIPGVAANAAMIEVEPGVYQGRYTVKPGDTLLRQPVKVTFIAPGDQKFVRLSRRPVTIQTVANYLPRITYPVQGQDVQSPIVVKGVAKPGSPVRVTIEYRANLGTILPIQGLTAVSEVRADQSGSWETPPLPAVVPFYEDRKQPFPGAFGELSDIFKFPEEPPVIYTITAVGIGSDGKEQTAYSIEVTQQEGKVLY